MMHIRRSNLILGFHGCDRSVAEKLVSGQESMHSSRNDYDWLGNGMYFWEYNEERAMQFAMEHPANKDISQPAVVGAVIDLGVCLDLLDTKYLDMLKGAYNTFSKVNEETGDAMPENRKGPDRLLRYLDCAVIEFLHSTNRRLVECHQPGAVEFDSVRAVFEEGDELYPGSAFRQKNHIQICVRNEACIKGFFHPRK